MWGALRNPRRLDEPLLDEQSTKPHLTGFVAVPPQWRDATEKHFSSRSSHDTKSSLSFRELLNKSPNRPGLSLNSEISDSSNSFK
jgi:hypothetical protein